MSGGDDARMNREAIVLIDHGSRRSQANEQLEELAALVRAARPGATVRTAHLEIAQPDLAAAIEECASAGATRIVVHPFFLAPGRHTTEDIPRLVVAARERHPALDIALAAPLGLDERIVSLVLARVDEAPRD